jgi:hypothetical protein
MAVCRSQTNSNSEQCIPLLGLSAIARIVDPHTTVQKMVFLVEYLPKAHVPTTIISFSALFGLVGFRWFKNKFKNTWWIYRIPEVLLVVLLSSGENFRSPGHTFLTVRCLVLSDELRWDNMGVDILGSVDVHTGDSFIEFPLKHSNLKFLHRTTSTAAYGYLLLVIALPHDSF